MWNITAIAIGLINFWGQSPSPKSSATVAGIDASHRFTVEKLVQDVFVGGACKNTFNIQGIGNKGGIGYFENGQSIIGIKRGVILSTGPIENSEGPNDSRRASGDFKDLGGDPDLQRLTQAGIQDAVGIEFDFVPLDSLVTFRYVFASEEYCEFVGSKFNDVFGFFVSGPGINGSFSRNAINVALVPGSQDFVSINTINHNVNPNFFVRNELKDDADRCGIPWNNSPNLGNIQYDGYTQVMTATLKLRPCETYHLRLMISDVNDGQFDSAVFLEAESFNIGGSIQLAAGNGVQADTITEGCGEGQFMLSRKDPTQTTLPLTIGIRVANASAAKVGVDFKDIPTAVTIPIGQVSAVVKIESILDQFNEGLEDIILELDFPCSCITDTARLYIEDPPPLRTGLRTVESCIGDTVQLKVQASGGVPPYHIRWSNGDTLNTFRAFAKVDTTYRLTMRDQCGRSISDEVIVRRRRPPEARLNALREICTNDTVSIPVYFSGFPPYSFTYALNGVAQQKVETFDNPYNINTSMEGRIELLQFRDALCEGKVSGRAEIRTYQIKTLATSRQVSCFGSNDGSVRVEAAGGTAPYQFRWSGSSINTADLQNLRAGKYAATITDARGCTSNIEVEVGQPPALDSITFECQEFSGPFISFAASGGTPPYLYSINGAPFQNEQVFSQLNSGERYALRIQDAAGCLLSQNFIMPARFDKMVELDAAVLLELGQDYTLSPKLNIPESLLKSIKWQPATGLSCTDCLKPLLRALKNDTYTLQIEDIYGCIGSAFVNIKLNQQIDLYIPNAFSPNGDGLNDLLVVHANRDQIRRIVRIQVFNRWGLLLHEDQDFLPNEGRRGWDGRFKGFDMRPDVYTYVVTVELADGQTKLRKGEVVLMR
jgi:gliding motility-associated-like protein